MSTAAGAAVTGRDAELAVAAGPVPVDPADRGELTIADRVVERVAGYAATQVEGASAAPRRVLGINVGDARPDDEAAVRARVDGGTATVEATIAVEWPHPISVVADRLRRRVRDDVAHLTDVQVAHIDLDVVSLPVASARTRRVQ